MNKYRWDFLSQNRATSYDEVFDILVKNRKFTAKYNLDITPWEYVTTDGNFIELVNNNIIPALEEISQAIRDKKPIVIYGDYDVDGQTATAILWRTIYKDLEYENVFPYIPNRFDEGYGLSTESINGVSKLLETKGFALSNSLLITVDCGIVSVAEIEALKNLGTRVILTDHHHKGSEEPSPHHLIWTEQATGAGIAWLIAHKLLGKYNKPDESYLDLAALGTICDLQPLTGFNRSIAKHGINQLNNGTILGIEVLKKVISLEDKIDTYHIGWVIGPHLNASGRLESAMDSLRLLSTESEDQAKTIGESLKDLNRKRQDKTQSDLEYAINQLDIDPKTTTKTEIPKFLVSFSPTYHEGIIGLIAGKLVQTYYRPSIAIAVDQSTGKAKGSARSIEGISIIEALHKFDPLFEKLGGHDMAAGFSLPAENISKLIESLNTLNEWDENTFTPKIKVDMEIPAELIHTNTVEKIQTLKPFGVGNSEPLFVTRSLKVFNSSFFGKENQHLRLFMSDDQNNKITGIMFNADNSLKLGLGDKVDVAYNLSINEWNGNRSLELKLKDLKVA